MAGVGRIGIASLLAFSIVAILVSPVVPSPLTTLQHKHSLQPASAPAIGGLALASLRLLALWQASALRDASVAMRAPDLVDLTTARLC